MRQILHKIPSLMNRIKDYFYQQPLPFSAVQLTSHYFSGIHVSSRENRILHHFILPIEPDIIQPSFYKKNIMNETLLEPSIKEGIKRLHLSDHKIAFLLPESSQKAFIFSFDSFPSSAAEREQIIRFRIKKKMPLIPDDARLDFDMIQSNHNVMVVASIARTSVIKEYEDLFRHFKLKVGVIDVPFLSLTNLLNKEKENDVLIINIEGDSFTLIGFIDSRLVLYRQKSMVFNSRNMKSMAQGIDVLIQEIENTTNFIEDREKRKISSLWIRVGLIDSDDELFSHLSEKLAFPVKGIESLLDHRLPLKEKRILSPLIGQLL